MKTPRYTDSHRDPHGYRTPAQTDIRKTFARVRAEQKAAAEATAQNEAEAASKTRTLQRKTA